MNYRQDREFDRSEDPQRNRESNGHDFEQENSRWPIRERGTQQQYESSGGRGQNPRQEDERGYRSGVRSWEPYGEEGFEDRRRQSGNREGSPAWGGAQQSYAGYTSQSNRPREYRSDEYRQGEHRQGYSSYGDAGFGGGGNFGGGYRDWNRGQFTGKGPKGYRRSDERIEEEINEALTRHPDLDASDIEVKLQNGEVTLSGTVSERRFKRMAEDVVEQCAGVQDVRNEIRVQRSTGEADAGNSTQQAKARNVSAVAGRGSEGKAM